MVDEMLEWTGERYLPFVDPKISGAGIHFEHLHRYYFASQFVKDKKVLDLGCGEGYGSFILSKSAKHVIGIDIDKRTIEHAKNKYVENNLEFIQGSVIEVPIKGRNLFDVVVGFEILEHLKEHDELISEVKRLLKHKGILIVSTPDKKVYSELDLKNPFHKKELYYNEFKELLKRTFDYIYFFGQRVYAGSYVWSLEEFNNISEEYVVERRKNLFSTADVKTKKPIYFIAIASDKEIDTSNSALRSYLIDKSNVIFNDYITCYMQQFTEPMGRLLALYMSRPDLQSTFPEVKNGKYSRLLKWARDVLATGRDNASGAHADYAKWYRKSKWLKLADDLKKTRGDHVKLESTIQDLETEKTRLANDLKKTRRDHVKLESTIQELETEKTRLANDLKKTDIELANTYRELSAIKESFGYHLMQFYPRIHDLFLKGIVSSRLWRIIKASHHIAVHKGIPSLFKKTWEKKIELEFWKIMPDGNYYSLNLDKQYQIWLDNNRPTKEIIKKMVKESDGFRYRPKISIVMPVYNTDKKWLKATIESLIGQIYPNWELCIADDASTKKHVRKILDEYGKRDNRVRAIYLKKNSGIVHTSNAAISLATGEFIGFLDHDDELMPDALYEVVKLLNEKPDLDYIYTDEDKKDEKGRRVEPFFKPDWSPDLLLSMNYPCHLSVYRKSLLDSVGALRKGFEGSQDYDLILRVTEKTDRIGHIAKPLYSWRKIPGSAATAIDAKPYAHAAAMKALREALDRRRIEGKVVEGHRYGYYRVRYKNKGEPLVSIIILTKDYHEMLRRCIKSIESKTAYRNYEIIILDHNSKDPKAIKYLRALSSKYKILKYTGEFNFSKMNNLCVKRAKGEHIVFLNNDTEVKEPDWLEAMLEHSQRPNVGIVGSLLLYPSSSPFAGKIQHGGVLLGVGGFANHAFRSLSAESSGYFMLPRVIRNCSAVTAACAMMRKKVFEEVGGFNDNLSIAFNDVDLCLRLRERGYLVVYTPFSVLLHHEQATRGQEDFQENETYALNRWGNIISKGDPYYNPNLTTGEDFCLVPKNFKARPMSILFEIYYLRPDLRRIYQEVEDGNYQRLIDWAVKSGVTIDSSRHLLRPYYSWYVENASKKVKPLGELLELYNIDFSLQKSFPEVLGGDFTQIIAWASKIKKADCRRNPKLKRLLPYLSWYRKNTS